MKKCTILKRHQLYLKTMNYMWTVPLVIINVVMPLFFRMTLKRYAEGGAEAIDYNLKTIIWVTVPFSVSFISAFFGEMFFSDKYSDNFFFCKKSKFVIPIIIYSAFFLIDSFIVIFLYRNNFICFSIFILFVLGIVIFYLGASIFSVVLTGNAFISILTTLIITASNILFKDFIENGLFVNVIKPDKIAFIKSVLPYLCLGILLIFLSVLKTTKKFRINNNKI